MSNNKSPDHIIDWSKLTVKELLILLNSRVEQLEKDNLAFSTLQERVYVMEQKLHFQIKLQSILAGLIGGTIGTIIQVIVMKF